VTQGLDLGHAAISSEIGKIGGSLVPAFLMSAFIALEAAGQQRRCDLWCDAFACGRFVSKRCIVSTFLLRLYSSFVVLFHAVPPVVLPTTYENAQILEDFDSVTCFL